MKPGTKSISSPTDRAVAHERKFKSTAHSGQVAERLYVCDNGLSLGARRGGASHLSDGTNWEAFTMHNGVVIGEAEGFIPTAQLERLVVRLAGWLDEKAA